MSSASHRRSHRGRLIAVAAAVALAAGGAYIGVQLSSGGLPTSGLATQWKRDRPPEDCPGSYAPWTMGRLIVTCTGGAGVAAYRLDTGSAAWTWQVPKAPGIPAVDSLSTGTDDGIGVVEYTYGEGSAYLAGLEITTGRELWSLHQAPGGGHTIWVSGGRFAVVDPAGLRSAPGLAVYDLRTGRLAWSGSPSPAGCHISDAAIAVPWVYEVAACGADLGDRLYQLSLQTGGVLASATLQDGACESGGHSPTIWAVPGYLLSGCDDAPRGGPDVIVIPAGGTRQLSLSWTGNPRYIDYLGEDLAPPDMAVSGSTLYLGQDIITQDRDVYQIAAIDLRAARVRWYKTVSVPGEGAGSVTHPLNLIGADSSGVLDVIENISGNSTDTTGSIGVTLATLSAQNGTMAYGPGTTYSGGLDNQPQYWLAGHLLLALPVCGQVGGCNSVTGTVAAYNTGSWPPN